MNEFVNGELGWKGETGDSAYEIAVKHGYTGTEAQWSDDFLNAENYYDKTETDTLLGNYYTKTECDTKYVANGNIVKLTGTANVVDCYCSKEIPYPTGFNQSNSYIICAKYKPENRDIWFNITYLSGNFPADYPSAGDSNPGAELVSEMQVYYDEEAIMLLGYDLFNWDPDHPTGTYTSNYEIVLMKIS